MPSYPPAVQEMILRCVQVERNHFPDVRKLVLGVIKKGSFPVVLNRTVGFGKGKKGNYSRFRKKTAHFGFGEFCMRQTVLYIRNDRKIFLKGSVLKGFRFCTMGKFS